MMTHSRLSQSLLLAAILVISSAGAFSLSHHRRVLATNIVRSGSSLEDPRGAADAAPPTVLQTATTPDALGGGEEPEPTPPSDVSSSGGGDSTIPAAVFNLVKGIVGAGVLTLPAGIAAYGNAASAVIPAVCLIAAIGGLSGYCFGLIGRVCAVTKTTSFRDAWKESVSEGTSWMPACSVTCMTMFAILAFSMILADTFQALFLSAGLSLSKPVTLTGLTVLVLLPLCLLKNLSSLAPFSLVGGLGMCYTAIAMAVRYFGKSYLAGGKFATDLPATLRPAFGSKGAGAVLNPSSAILISMLSTAYMAHFNAPKFYVELKDNTIPRYMKMVGTSFGISIALMALIASLGFLTFGGSCSGLILNNYSVGDGLMGLSRIAVAASLVFSYPLAFVGARDGILDLMNVKDRSAKTLNVLTGALLSSITVLALVIPDVSFVMAFAGATLGNALIYIFPALMFRGAIRRQKQEPTGLQNAEVKLAMGSAVFGAGMGILGAVKAVQSIL